MTRRLLAALLLTTHLLLPHTALAAACQSTPSDAESLLPLDQRALFALVRALPAETRIGQLLMPGFVGTDPDPGLLERVAAGRLGGLYLIQRNVRSEVAVRGLTAALDETATVAAVGIHPFLATDFEGGTVNALRVITGNTASAIQLAARGTAGVESQGAADADALRWLGFNTNLAPVADVLTVAGGVIGTRAFATDPETAASLSRAYLRGLKSGGVIGVMKHFPGHGATADDSHALLPVVDRTLDQLADADLLPYRQAIDAGELDAVMVAHLSVPALDPESPTSLSRATIAGLLRDTLRFDGLVMTDELKMRAISARYGVVDAALMAIDAGVDVLLADWTGSDQATVYAALLDACDSGRLAAERVDRSVARILRLKLAYGLLAPDLVERYASLTAALAEPAEESPPEAMAPDALSPMETVPPAEEQLVPTPTTIPTAFPTPLSTQPTPVSVQPTPTRPPPTATASPTPTSTSTATRTPSPTATRSG